MIITQKYIAWIYIGAKERNPKTVTKHIVMLNFIDKTNLEKIHLHLCKKKNNTMGTEENWKRNSTKKGQFKHLDLLQDYNIIKIKT